nr:hypothetical protein [Halorubellus salinus]
MLGLFIDPVTWTLAVGWLALGGVVYVALQRRKGDPGDPGDDVEVTVDVEPDVDPDVDVPPTDD